MDRSSCEVAEHSWSDLDHISEIVVLVKGKRAHITIKPTNLTDAPSIETQYTHWMEVCEAQELDGLTIEDFHDWVIEFCLLEFSKLSAAPFIAQPTLADYIYLETLYYEMHAADGTLVLVQRDHVQHPYSAFGIRAGNDNLCEGFPATMPEDVYIVTSPTKEEDVLHKPPSAYQGPPSVGKALSRTPRIVSVQGKDYFFKFITASSYRQWDRELDRQLKVYRAIEEAKLTSLRTSRLFSVIRDQHGMVYGLLLNFIDAQNVTLSCAVKPDTPEYLRQRWANQITETIERLHKASIVWGDAKPENVLIDGEKNAWVIDFGGGYTEGWVEREFAETINGDKQGLAQIRKFLHSPMDFLGPLDSQI